MAYDTDERERERKREMKRREREGLTDELAGPDDREDAVHVLEDGEHHVLLGLGRLLVLRVTARVDDAVHVEVAVPRKHCVGRWGLQRYRTL